MGHFTKTVADSALLLQITAGPDGHDATASDRPVPNYSQNLGKSINGFKIGRCPEFFTKDLATPLKKIHEQALKIFQKQGAKIVDIKLPHLQYAVAAYYIIVPSEISANLARFDGIRFGFGRKRFGDEAKRRIMLGTYALSAGYYDAYYLQAMKVRTLIKQDFQQAFQKVDLIAAPVSPDLPFKLGQKTTDPLKMYLSDIFTVPANLAGLPALSVPIGKVDKLPVGLQLIGPQFSEALLLQTAHAYEQKCLRN